MLKITVAVKIQALKSETEENTCRHWDFYFMSSVHKNAFILHSNEQIAQHSTTNKGQGNNQMTAYIQAIASSDFTWTEELRHITNVCLLLIQVTVSILPGFPEQLASSQVINGTEDWKQQRITQLIIEWKPQVYKLSSTIMVTIHCECKLMFSKKIQGEVSAQADGSSSITCHQRQNMLGYTQKTCSQVYQSLLNSRLQSLSRFHTASTSCQPMQQKGAPLS